MYRREQRIPGRWNIWLSVISVAWAMFILCTGFSAAANVPVMGSDGITGYRIVFVVDTSDSMEQSDPAAAVKESAAMFVESLYIGKKHNLRGFKDAAVAVISYDDEARTIHEMEDLRTEEKVEEIRENIFSHLPYREGSGDHGLGQAVSTAVEILRGYSDSRKKMIILFTDGYKEDAAQQVSNDFPEDVQRTLDRSLDSAAGMQCEIYVLGMGEHRHWSRFRDIANATQLQALDPSDQRQESGLFPRDDDDPLMGRANYKAANNIDEVQDFCIRILSFLMQGREPYTASRDTENHWARYDMDISTERNSAVIVYIKSNDKIKEMSLASQHHNYNLDESNEREDGPWNFWGTHYVVLIIPNPEKGKWEIGAEGETMTTPSDGLFLLINGMELKVEVDPIGYTSEGNVVVRASYGNDPVNSPLTEAEYDDLLKRYHCTISPQNNFASEQNELEVSLSQRVTLNYSKSKQALTGTTPKLSAPGAYVVQFSILSPEDSSAVQVSKSSDPVIFKTDPDSVSVQKLDVSIDKKVPLTPSLPGWESMPMEVTDYDLDQRELLSVAMESKQASDVSADRIVIRGKAEGIVHLTVTVHNRQGTWKLPYEITVHPPAPDRMQWTGLFQGEYLRLLIVPVVIVVIIVVFVLIGGILSGVPKKRKRKKRKRKFHITIQLGNREPIENTVAPLRYDGLFSFSLYDLVENSLKKKRDKKSIEAVETCRKQIQHPDVKKALADDNYLICHHPDEQDKFFWGNENEYDFDDKPLTYNGHLLNIKVSLK